MAMPALNAWRGLPTAISTPCQHTTYQAKRGAFDKPRPTKVNIGERRKPAPDGSPGYLRVDSVHQGDLDGIKGVYLINAVDEVTQLQAVVAVERISAAYVLPVLEAMMDALPFVIRRFHSDNGSESLNDPVAKRLEKLRIEQTKSRSRQTNDHARAASKNASTVRKYLGYSHSPQHVASQVNTFTVEVLSPYLNDHRPCHFPSEYQAKKGKIRKRYCDQDRMTPYEKFRSLPAAEDDLKPGTPLEKLDALAAQCRDNEAAQRLNEARAELFQSSNKSQQSAA